MWFDPHAKLAEIAERTPATPATPATNQVEGSGRVADVAIVATPPAPALDVGPAETAAKAPWPKSMPDQIAAVRAALDKLGEASPEQVARQFQRARTSSVQPLLESLAALGQARTVEGGRYAT